MSDLLDNPLVVLYFQPEKGLRRANGDLVTKGMQQVIEIGNRILVVMSDGSIHEETAEFPNGEPYHPSFIRLPDKFQTDLVRVTCPDCKFTYTHQHIFAEVTK